MVAFEEILEKENPEAFVKLKKKIKKLAHALSKSFTEECVSIDKKKAKAERKRKKESADLKEEKTIKTTKTNKKLKVNKKHSEME